MGLLDRLTGRRRGDTPGPRVLIHGHALRLAQGTDGLAAYRRLRVDDQAQVRVRPVNRPNWPEAMSIELDGAPAGLIGMGELVPLVADIDRHGLALYAPAVVEDVNGKAFRVRLPWAGELAAWWYLPAGQRPDQYSPPRVDARMGRYDVDGEGAEALLQGRDLLVAPCTLSVEEVTRGQNKGKTAVVVTAAGHRVARVAPTQRARHADLFTAAESGAPGAVTVRRSSGHVTVGVAVH